MNAINYIRVNTPFVAHSLGWAAQKTAETIRPHIRKTLKIFDRSSHMISIGSAFNNDIRIKNPTGLRRYPISLLNRVVEITVNHLAPNGNPLTILALGSSIAAEHYLGGPYIQPLLSDDYLYLSDIGAGILGVLSLQFIGQRRYIKANVLCVALGFTGLLAGEARATAASALGLLSASAALTTGVFLSNLYHKLSGNENR